MKLKFLILTTLALPLTVFANSEDNTQNVLSHCSKQNIILYPTANLTVPYGNDSRGGRYNTTVIRNEIDGSSRNKSVRLATSLQPGQGVELKTESEFRFSSVRSTDTNSLLLKTKNRNFLFYCGSCSAVPSVTDILKLKNEDGTPFFRAVCATPPKPRMDIIVPATDHQDETPAPTTDTEI